MDLLCFIAGLIHPGLIGTAPSHELLQIWNKRERELVEAGPEATTLGGVLHTRPLGEEEEIATVCKVWLTGPPQRLVFSVSSACGCPDNQVPALQVVDGQARLPLVLPVLLCQENVRACDMPDVMRATLPVVYV